MLAQQASGFGVGGHKFHIKEKPMQENSFVLYVGTTESAQPTPRVGLAVLQGRLSRLPGPTRPVCLVRPQIGSFRTSAMLEPIWMLEELPLWII